MTKANMKKITITLNEENYTNPVDQQPDVRHVRTITVEGKESYDFMVNQVISEDMNYLSFYFLESLYKNEKFDLFNGCELCTILGMIPMVNTINTEMSYTILDHEDSTLVSFFPWENYDFSKNHESTGNILKHVIDVPTLLNQKLERYILEEFNNEIPWERFEWNEVIPNPNRGFFLYIDNSIPKLQVSMQLAPQYNHGSFYPYGDLVLSFDVQTKTITNIERLHHIQGIYIRSTIHAFQQPAPINNQIQRVGIDMGQYIFLMHHDVYKIPQQPDSIV